MDIDRSMRRRVDERDGQDLTVGGDDQARRMQLQQACHHLGGTDPGGGQDLDAELTRRVAHRSRRRLPSAPRPVRPGDHGHDVMPGCTRPERRHGE